jgi:hypothetical protein
MAKKPTKQQVAYGKARAGGQDAYKITAKEVKRTAKGVAKAAGLAATVVGPGKFIKAAKVAKAAKSAATTAARAATKNEARMIAAKRAAATPAAKRTAAEKLAMKRVVTNQSTGATKVRYQSKVDVNKLVKESKKSTKPSAPKEKDYEKYTTTQYNPKTGKKELLISGDSKASQARMTEFKRQGFGKSGNVVRKFK